MRNKNLRKGFQIIEIQDHDQDQGHSRPWRKMSTAHC